MSKSYRKNAKIGSSRRSSERYFKTEYNRRTRSQVNNIIKSTHIEDLDDAYFPTKHIEYADVWDSRSDGPKIYFGEEKFERQRGYRLDVDMIKNIIAIKGVLLICDSEDINSIKVNIETANKLILRLF